MASTAVYGILQKKLFCLFLLIIIRIPTMVLLLLPCFENMNDNAGTYDFVRLSVDKMSLTETTYYQGSIVRHRVGKNIKV